MNPFKKTPKARQSDVDTLKADIDELRNELTKRTNALSLVTAVTNGLDQKILVLDQRITSMGSEFANQLHELGAEIESVSANSPGSVSQESIDHLQSSQTRLAKEQARYEIAFRKDLAELGEQIRRLGKQFN